MKSDNKFRELDDWLAERVMGWKLNDCGFWIVNQQLYQSTGFMRFPPQPQYSMCDNTYFNPHKNAACAFLVLKKCCEKQGPTSVSFCQGFKDGWQCGNERAETLELAICFFAKKLFSKEKG